MVKKLLHKLEDLSSDLPNPCKKSGAMVHTYNPNIRETGKTDRSTKVIGQLA